MRTLTAKEQGELNFWANYVLGGGCEQESGRSYIDQWSSTATGRLNYYREQVPEIAAAEHGVWADVGCGPYPVLLHAPKQTTAVMIDPLMKHYFAHGLVPAGAIGPGRAFIESFIEDLPLPDESIDVLMCLNCLDHVDDPWTGLRELTRVIKIGGHLILEVDLGGTTDYMHPHAFGREELEATAESCGLKNVKWNLPDGGIRRPGATLYYGFYRRVERTPAHAVVTPLKRSVLQPVLVKEGVKGFNIIRMPDFSSIGSYFALHQSEGAFYYEKAIAGQYRRCYDDIDLDRLIAKLEREF